MKSSISSLVGRSLMRLNPLKISVVDDVRTYFNEDMISIARAAGYINIERLYHIDRPTLERLLQNPPDIIILDIKGITDRTVAKDGFDIAEMLSKHTHTFIVVTSAHQFKLRNEQLECDYVIDQRLLTPVDFVSELHAIVGKALEKKISWFRKVLFRLGFSLMRAKLGNL